jgi:hypothetical protein
MHPSSRPPPSRRLGRLGLAAPLLALGAFLVLGAGSSTAVVTAFWVLQGLASILAISVLFWRSPAMPGWARALAALTLAGQAAFVVVLYRGLSQLN